MKRSVCRAVGERIVRREIARLEDIPRSATVRCLILVDVLMLRRGDVQLLGSGFSFFGPHFRKVSLIQRGASDSSKDKSVQIEHDYPTCFIRKHE